MHADSDSSALRPPVAESGWRTRAFLPDPRLTFPAVFAERAAAAPGRGIIRSYRLMVRWSPRKPGPRLDSRLRGNERNLHPLRNGR